MKKDRNTGYPGKSAVMKNQGLEVGAHKKDAPAKRAPKVTKTVGKRTVSNTGAATAKQTHARKKHPASHAGIIGRRMAPC